MHDPSRASTSTARRALFAALAAAGALVGCSRATRAPAEPISLAAFATEAGSEPVADEGTTAQESGARPSAPLVAAGPSAAGAPDLGPPSETSVLPPLAPGDRVVVDSLVGQVNGRPIFADQFFDALEDELLALARRASRREFIQTANVTIQRELQQVVLNSLFLAEAEAGLTEEEQVGLRYWLKDTGERITAQAGGSQEALRAKLRRERGQSLEAYIGTLRDEALIRRLLQERIAPRVIVAWRDIEREYSRRSAEFNPPTRVVLARIRLRTDADAERIAEVERRLGAGDEFMTIVGELGTPAAEPAWQTIEVRGKDLGEMEFPNPEGKAAVAPLDGRGQTTRAFQIGTSTWWLHTAEWAKPEGRSIYDPVVQRQLSSEIRAERSTEEQNRYIRMLLEEGIYDELDQMGQRLLAIAVLRYAPPT